MNISLDSKEIDKIMNTLSIGMSRSFRLLGGTALLISIWQNNELGIKLSLITFIYGGFAKIIEMLNKDINRKFKEKDKSNKREESGKDDNQREKKKDEEGKKEKKSSTGYEAVFWLFFIVSYMLAVNSYTEFLEVSSLKIMICK